MNSFYLLADADQFPGRSSSNPTNEDNLLNIPAVSRILKGFKDLGNKVPINTVINNTYNGQIKHPSDPLVKLYKEKDSPWKSTLRYNPVFPNGRKGLHGNLQRLISASLGRRLNQDIQTLLSQFTPRYGGGKSGNFKIAGEKVSGKGVYSISPDQSDVGIKLTIKVSNKPHMQQKPTSSQTSQLPSSPPKTLLPSTIPPTRHQSKPKSLSTAQLSRQQQQQQQQQNMKSTPRPSPPRTTPKMCLAPCTTTNKTKTAVANCVGEYH